MKKSKKISIIIIIVLVLFLILGVTYKTLKNENRLTTQEKAWITDNTSNIQNISVINDVSVIGNNGVGIIYSFIKDLQEEYSIKINPITYNIGAASEGRAFIVKSSIDKNDLLFYTEHYVLVNKDNKFLESSEDLKKLKIGINKEDKDIIQNRNNTLDLHEYDTKDDLLKAFDSSEEIDYMIVPLNVYLPEILKNDYKIVYHLSDIKRYYVFQGVDEDYLSSIISKFFAKWSEDKLNLSINESTLQVFQSALNISAKDIDALRANVYNYGFVNNSPYEIVSNGEYSGIINEYLRSFSDFANVEFKFIKYKNFKTFNNALNDEKIDIYFDYYLFNNNYHEVQTLLKQQYVIIANIKSNLVVNSIDSIKDNEIYVLENSKLKEYLSGIQDIKIKTFSDIKELTKIDDEKLIVVIDTNVFDYYSKDLLKNFSVRYNGQLPVHFNFKFKSDNMLSYLFEKYIQIIDPDESIYSGIYSHNLLASKGGVLSVIAEYFLIAILIFAIVFFGIIKNSKKVKMVKKIKKDERIKFIDYLTSLKNRNYLKENIDNWNKNTIYPQTTIIVDLNQVQEINDSLGYEQGDSQIKAAANILIKNQLDNSDIMRTDGNEFLIYLVGYSEKQIVSYIRKLYKEFKALPYEYGAAIGYSMITDNIKTLEDAINEAVEDMKNKKGELSGD